jgi:hypothetical protein
MSDQSPDPNVELKKNTEVIRYFLLDFLKKPEVEKGSLQEILSDGTILCSFANAFKPGCIRKFHGQFHSKPTMQMRKIENIGLLYILFILNCLF